MASSVFSNDYIARYEYACSLIQLFFERELSVNATSKDNQLFDPNSAAGVLFTTDYSRIVGETVRSQVSMQLTRLSKDESNFLLARIHGVLLDFYSILGNEFVEKLIDNTAHGIAAVGGMYQPSKDEYKDIRKFIDQHPELLVFIMGNKLYQTEFLKRRLTKEAPAIV